MTEAEWLAANQPFWLVKSLVGKASDRKLRLFTCSCVWRLRDPDYGLEGLERNRTGRALRRCPRFRTRSSKRAGRCCVRTPPNDTGAHP
jgi:hypothetical protein